MGRIIISPPGSASRRARDRATCELREPAHGRVTAPAYEFPIDRIDICCMTDDSGSSGSGPMGFLHGSIPFVGVQSIQKHMHYRSPGSSLRRWGILADPGVAVGGG